jgi:hypothetical protein
VRKQRNRQIVSIRESLIARCEWNVGFDDESKCHLCWCFNETEKRRESEESKPRLLILSSYWNRDVLVSMLAMKKNGCPKISLPRFFH